MSLLASSLRHQPETSLLIERQIQRWLMLQQAEADKDRCEDSQRPAEACGHYISISREAGAGGEQVARAVSERLGWSVLDRELLGLVAQAAHCSANDVELIDETGMRWLTELFNHWIDRAPVSHEKYVICLAAAMRAVARRGNVVIVGRGSQFLLPRETGLAVRIVASRKFRVEHARRVRGLSAKEAREWVERTDRNRREFVEQHFHRDPNDVRLYDLMINVEKLGIDGAARQIAEAARSVFV
jgi:cytidylate kinase